MINGTPSVNMRPASSRMLCMTAGLFALIIVASAAMAQTTGLAGFPNRPIRMIVGFSAGGSTDMAARNIGLKLSEALGQSVIIDNRTGANGTIAAGITAKAPADGYTLLTLSIAQVIANAYETKLPYDVLRDFAPVSQTVQQPYLVVVNPSMPAHSIQELIGLAKAKPGQINYGSAGTAGSNHLFTELFSAAVGIRMVHVPYKGAAPALADVVGGQVELMFSSMGSALALVRSGKLRALAVTTSRRAGAASEIPTVAETIPGYVAISWDGVVAPKATPPAIVNFLSATIAKALQSPDVKERLAAGGLETVGNTPAQFDLFIRNELARFAKVIKDAGIRSE